MFPGDYHSYLKIELASDRFLVFLQNWDAPFQGKCPITQCDVETAMDAAHIFPYRGPQTDCVWNGILLRLDLHRLFDAYLLTIDPVECQVYVSPSLMNSYGQYANTRICFPEQPVSENRLIALRWHNAQCSWFKGSIK